MLYFKAKRIILQELNTMTPDIARICPITKEPCVANCKPDRPCWIEKIAPFVANDTDEILKEEANGRSQLNGVSDIDRISIQKSIEKQAINILQKRRT
jgi:hypothetical protein